MKLERIVLGKLGVNSYMLLSEKAAIVIDPAKESKILEDFLNNARHKERLILLTHCHFDHIDGADVLREKTGVKIAIGKSEAPSLLDTSRTLADNFYAKTKPFSADILLEDMQTFSVADIEITPILSPGHTEGSMCYKTDIGLFSGDVLFKLSVGRTDFPFGDTKALINSLDRLKAIIEDDTAIYPGHGEATVMGYEKKNNPYLRYTKEDFI